MTEEEVHRHLKGHLFHGLKPNLCNALHYLYDKPDAQYSQLVMASRKAETETFVEVDFLWNRTVDSLMTSFHLLL